MSLQHRVLIVGGIRSGKSRLAEELLGDVDPVRYIATSPDPGDDESWAARLAVHRERRPATWHTEEIGAEPQALAGLLADAKPDEVVLVDDLGGWLNALLQAGGDWSDPTTADAAIDELAGAVRACPARLVLVGPEVGLTVAPATEAGRTFADANGTLNQKVAEACDAVALAVAGQLAWLRGGPPVTDPGARRPFTVDTVKASRTEVPADLSMPDLQPGMDLPMPDEQASVDAVDRLSTLDFAGTGLGRLVPLIRFAAATQAVTDPRPWQSPRVLLLRGDHFGGAAAGDSPAAADRRFAQAVDGVGPLAVLAAGAGATVRAIDCPPAAAMETGDALEESTVDGALGYGWQLANQAADEGADVIVLAACGCGGEAAATAIVSLTAGGEPAALLGRVARADGYVDDAAWMQRCVAVRDALQRVRLRSRDPRELLAMLGGGDIAVATGIILGATYRCTPVLVDGPVGVGAAMVAREFGAQTRHWLLLTDHGGHKLVQHAGEVLGLTPTADLQLGLGEGASALAALPWLNTALTLAATTPEAQPLPPAAAEPDAEPDEETEPDPELSEEEQIEAEILRVVVDSPTAEMPYFQRPER
jgi:adenosyl cobinamide kinase/adenosyl cobinamide phosphate guanylyltransferase/NaMN:DMB phosphoribosyltransferase